jgi:hypothetical protein
MMSVQDTNTAEVLNEDRLKGTGLISYVKKKVQIRLILKFI